MSCHDEDEQRRRRWAACARPERPMPTPLRQGPNNPSSRKIGNGRTLDMSAEKTRTRPGRPNAGKIQPVTSPTQPRGKNAPHEEPELHIPVVHAKPSQHLCTGPRKEQPRETAKLPGLYRTRQALKTLGDKMRLQHRYVHAPMPRWEFQFW